MAGIQETKDVLAFVFALSEVSVTAMETGDIGWSDAKNFIDPLKRLGPGIENVEDVLIELQDFDDTEFEELIQFTRDEFGVENLTDDLEVVVEEAINAGVEIMKIIRMFKNS
ncbi:uncharacterized protein METZ01_LOCUS339512 [marine metagenome]|uniref:Uncharacterized protein n=1 Tax=marine metagenome TaxID=408172 RepID=A0A382QNY2_9ZZZZ|tara:strand:+ start:2139 stop:2474 length:336 start_codon:yes stop_codon:yes gene_type:complete